MLYIQYKNQFDSWIKQIQSAKQPVIIFGTDQLARTVQDCLQTRDVPIACLCDNNPNRIGMTIRNALALRPDEAYKQFPHAVYILCGFDVSSRTEMQTQLDGLGNTHQTVLPDSFYCVHIIETGRPVDRDSFSQSVYQWFHRQNDLFALSAVTLETTQICTLRCKKCSMFMPYYPCHEHYDSQMLIESAERFAECLDVIPMLNILGGEALYHPDILSMINKIPQIPNILALCIVTNATHIPTDQALEAMASHAVALRISDYGPSVSIRLDEIIKKCEAFGVTWYALGRAESWVDVGKPEKHGRTDAENREAFRNCVFASTERVKFRNCMIHKGKFYLCDRFAAFLNLGILSETDLQEHEYLNILDSSTSLQDKQKKLMDMIQNTSMLSTCEYCNYPMPVIPAGEQL